jgi:hypothetical protein
MVYVSRNIIYIVFGLVFALSLLSIIFFVALSDGLDVRDASVTVNGENVEFNSTLKNISNHAIKNIEIIVENNNGQKTELIDVLKAGEKKDIQIILDFSTDLTYDVYVNAAFNKSKHLLFELEGDTIRPVTAKVEIVSEMVVGKTYEMVIRLCNDSDDDLFDVYWIEKIEGDYFEESFFPRHLFIGKDQCKSFYPTLTPLVPGKANIEFVLRVGGLEQNEKRVITISDK